MKLTGQAQATLVELEMTSGRKILRITWSSGGASRFLKLVPKTMQISLLERKLLRLLNIRYISCFLHPPTVLLFACLVVFMYMFLLTAKWFSPLI